MRSLDLRLQTKLLRKKYGLPKSINGKSLAPTQAQIEALRTVITSGVEGAGYGDKRTDFRSLNELRQILNAMEDELDGGGGRIRQIRMTSPSDKGL
jgi:hypothetical protein